MKINIVFLIFIPFIKTLIDDDLKIQTSIFGAELISIKYKGKEYLHDETVFWDKKSPILFPIVGRLKYGETRINGKDYKIPLHGFASNMNFTEIGEHSYKLTSNNKTLEQYPFEFELYVSYSTNQNKLFFNYSIINIDNQTMLFGIGAHPGFKTKYFEEKTLIEFEEEENNIKIIPVVLPEGLLSNETKDGNTLLKNRKILEIKKDSFDQGALVFTDIKSKSIILKDNGKKILKFNFDEFKYLGIWSAKGEAPFICLEPWYNTADYINSTKEFKDKKDIIKLEPNARFNTGFNIEFFDEPNNATKSIFLSIFSFIYLIMTLF